MLYPRQQTTLANTLTVSGRGFWTGVLNTLTMRPAEAGEGIQFVRADLDGKPRAKATCESSQGIALRTQLQHGAATFEMIEHVMSALYGMGIDNAVVESTAAEMPGFDGSSHLLSLAIQNAGAVGLSQPRPMLVVDEVIQIGDAERFIRVEPRSAEQTAELEVVYELDFGSESPIKACRFHGVVTPENYSESIAPARTFISQADATALQQSGVAQHVTERDLLVFGPNGPINNELRFANECARHKALDVIGDLALAGCNLIGRVVARRSGHQLNGEMANVLRDKHLKQQKGSLMAA
ncbi:MAG: UDP-3-O-acyl-N-acetylglucosamine deacetylase [Aureliella sp.]